MIDRELIEVLIYLWVIVVACWGLYSVFSLYCNYIKLKDYIESLPSRELTDNSVAVFVNAETGQVSFYCPDHKTKMSEHAAFMMTIAHLIKTDKNFVLQVRDKALELYESENGN